MPVVINTGGGGESSGGGGQKPKRNPASGLAPFLNTFMGNNAANAPTMTSGTGGGGGQPITPTVPPPPNTILGEGAATNYAAGAGGNVLPSTPDWASPWGTTYSDLDKTALASDPATLLIELLSGQGRNNPTQTARYGDMPQALAAIMPLLVGNTQNLDENESLNILSQLLTNASTPGAGGLDLNAILQRLLSGNSTDPVMQGIQGDPNAVNQMINAIMAMGNPMLAPYIARAFGNAQDQWGSATLDANGGQNINNYAQWLAQQVGM
jgi:hypothetical protein